MCRIGRGGVRSRRREGGRYCTCRQTCVGLGRTGGVNAYPFGLPPAPHALPLGSYPDHCLALASLHGRMCMSTQWSSSSRTAVVDQQSPHSSGITTTTTTTSSSHTAMHVIDGMYAAHTQCRPFNSRSLGMSRTPFNAIHALLSRERDRDRDRDRERRRESLLPSTTTTQTTPYRHPSIHPSIHPSVHPPISIHPSIHPSTHPPYLVHLLERLGAAVEALQLYCGLPRDGEVVDSPLLLGPRHRAVAEEVLRGLDFYVRPRLAVAAAAAAVVVVAAAAAVVVAAVRRRGGRQGVESSTSPSRVQGRVNHPTKKEKTTSKGQRQ